MSGTPQHVTGLRVLTGDYRSGPTGFPHNLPPRDPRTSLSTRGVAHRPCRTVRAARQGGDLQVMTLHDSHAPAEMACWGSSPRPPYPVAEENDRSMRIQGDKPVRSPDRGPGQRGAG